MSLFETVVPVIRNRFPSLDIRTDQCAIVRIITKTRLLALEAKEGQFVGSVYALDGKYDFETPLVKEFRENELGDFTEAVLRVAAEIST